MKPVKPKKLSRALEDRLRGIVSREMDGQCGFEITVNEMRAILAALEYERQQTEKIASIIREMFDERVLDPYPTSDGSYEYQLREMVGWESED